MKNPPLETSNDLPPLFVGDEKRRVLMFASLMIPDGF
jgi:hypothetical protein